MHRIRNLQSFKSEGHEEDPETMEYLTVHVDSLAFSSPRLRDEIASEPFVPFNVPFRSLSNSSLAELGGECQEEPSCLSSPLPFHELPPTPDSLDFLDQHRSQCKCNIRGNSDGDYAYFFISRREWELQSYPVLGIMKSSESKAGERRSLQRRCT